MKNIFTYLIILIFLCGCKVHHEETLSSQEPTSLLYNINESASIIMQLIKKDQLHSLLLNERKEETLSFIKNFSPAEMAFEAEVLSNQNPVLILYYSMNDPGLQEIHTILTKIGDDKIHSLKIVKIDVQELFKLADQAMIDSTPTLILIHQRKEVDRI